MFKGEHNDDDDDDDDDNEAPHSETISDQNL